MKPEITFYKILLWDILNVPSEILESFLKFEVIKAVIASRV